LENVADATSVISMSAKMARSSVMLNWKGYRKTINPRYPFSLFSARATIFFTQAMKLFRFARTTMEIN